ncbi:MAG: class I SAM-dependent methyltransferase [Gemmatimonadaceae bacterium]|nr:class I SAM-dependent methyltransferase [Gemmatimonadaceae bacterium]
MAAGRGARRVEQAIAHNARAYDAVAATYERTHPEIFNDVEQARLADAVRDVLAACRTGRTPPRVLDVGSGTGNLTAHFLSQGVEVVSADISTVCLAMVGERFRASGRHAVQRLDGTTLAPFADGAFDVAACYSVLHHVPDYLALVSEMARVVRTGGLVYIDHERHDASWTDPAYAAYMAEAWVFPPKRWTRFLDPRAYWRRIQPLLQWRRWADRRWMPEGDLHIWPDDHIEWSAITARLATHGVAPVIARDFLLYNANLDRTVWERWRHQLTDHRMWVGRKG